MRLENVTLFIWRLPLTKDRPARLEVQSAVQHRDFVTALKEIIKPGHREWDQNRGVWSVAALPEYVTWLTEEAPRYFGAAFLIEGAFTTNLITGRSTEQLTLF